MEEVKGFFKTGTPALTDGIEGVLLILLGGVLALNNLLFIDIVNLILAILFCFYIIANLTGALFALKDGWKPALLRLANAAIALIAGAVLGANFKRLWALVPLVLGVYALLLGAVQLIQFLQYRHEKTVGHLAHLIGAVLQIAFGLSFLGGLVAHIPFGLAVAGIYFILFGLTRLFDCIDALLPADKKRKAKRRVRILLPAFISALIPGKALNTVNEYLAAPPQEEIENRLHAARENANTPNVEVFVHVSPDGAGRMGHVDLCVDGNCISYGGYDTAAMKLGGAMGPGTIFSHNDRDAYIAFCQRTSNKTLFAFGLYFTPQQLEKLYEKLHQIEKNCYEWKPDAHLAAEGDLPQGDYKDYGSELYRATGATFYKFTRGQFKYYFVLGLNCVKFADTLLKASGSDTVMAGIISPGTYFEFLNREFKRVGGCVLTRTVYHPEKSDS